MEQLQQALVVGVVFFLSGTSTLAGVFDLGVDSTLSPDGPPTTGGVATTVRRAAVRVAGDGDSSR